MADAQTTLEMQQTATEIKNIIISYGNAVTLRNYGTKTYDEYGEPTYTDATDVVTSAVTDSKFINKLRLSSAGRIDDSSTVILIHKDDIIDKDYTVLISSTEYNITSIEELIASAVLLAYQVTLGKK